MSGEVKHTCQAGEPIIGKYCAKCGASDSDFCGEVEDQKYQHGLLIIEMSVALEMADNAFDRLADQGHLTDFEITAWRAVSVALSKVRTGAAS